ncbi:uncharacterized protein [Leptinotarsa decemlineata]|uniref:uncharacterized protein n=1 Tax=Leptinotarsa decemlineata TaxID=7539 RepID=UPI003D304821
MDLQKLNASSIVKRKPSIKVADLPVEMPQRIFTAKIVKGKFGEAVLLALGDKVSFLPHRVTEAYRPHLEECSSGKYAIVFKGLIDIGKPNLVVSFEIVQNKE